MFRKKRQPAPNFRMPGAPFNPVTGQRAQMGSPPTPGTILSTFQVIGDDPADAMTQDTHANYVVCRGFEPDIDPFFRYLHDPKTKPDTKSIKVAKPHSVRGTFPYKRGQVIVAARILTRLGANQGKASSSTGQPADLNEEVELLFDDDNVAISWLDIVTPSSSIIRGKLAGTLSAGLSATLNVWGWNGSAEAATGKTLTVYDWLLMSGQTIASGKKVTATLDIGSNRYYVIAAECP